MMVMGGRAGGYVGDGSDGSDGWARGRGVRARGVGRNVERVWRSRIVKLGFLSKSILLSCRGSSQRGRPFPY